MKLVIAATGASGTIYLQRLLAQIDCAANEVHLVMSGHAKQVAAQEVDRFPFHQGCWSMAKPISMFRSSAVQLDFDANGDRSLLNGYSGSNRFRL